jgi:hypothetical protein
MKYTGGQNLFTTHFVMGTKLPEFLTIDIVKGLNNWIQFKDRDYGMKNYRTSRTQYISFLHIIELPIFESVLKNLATIYKSYFPYGAKEDFLNYVFGYTITDLEIFIARKYDWVGAPGPSDKYDFYTYFDFNEYLDYAIPENETISHYKQYYKKILQIIKDVDFASITETKNANIEIRNIRSELFVVNEKNSLKLSEEYSFTDSEEQFIYRTFWPIIAVNTFDINEVGRILTEQKINFINDNSLFDVDIFKRDYLEYLIFELEEYIDVLQRGKSKIWDLKNGDYFHRFKLRLDTANSQTLLISNKNTTQIEIYFKQILEEIQNFIFKENAVNNKKNKTEKSFIDEIKPNSEDATRNPEELSNIISLKNNLIPSQKTLEIPYNFFKKLTTEKNKSDEYYLKEDELILFLKRAFNNQKEILEQKINIGTRENKKIHYFFYQFMVWSQNNDYEDEAQLNTKYIKILTDNFSNFNFDKVDGNFDKKPSKTIEIIK